MLKQLPFHELIPTTYHEACHQYLQFYIRERCHRPHVVHRRHGFLLRGIQENKGTKKLDSKMIDNRKLRMIQEKIATRTAIPLEKLIGHPRGIPLQG